MSRKSPLSPEKIAMLETARLMGKARAARKLIQTSEFELDIERLAPEFYSGNPYMLFEAIRRCAQYQIPMPEWIRREIEAGLDRYDSGQVREFGEAFGIVREKSVNLTALKKRQKDAWALFQFIESQKDGGATIDKAFENAPYCKDVKFWCEWGGGKYEKLG